MKRIYTIIVILVIGLVSVMAQDLSGITILVNPGHGGFDSDDRNMVIFPFTAGDPNGFWESQSNFDKGIQLRDLLESANATVVMSRLSNNPTLYDDKGNIIYTDDTPLSQIVAMANEAEADFMLSIHSNAGVTNYILQLYAGVDPDDTRIYPTPTPYSDESREVGMIIADNLYTNQANVWASAPTVRGDKTFARTAMGWSDGYGVLRGLLVPGCLSEGSMHDYIPETYRLMNMEYKWLEAWHFYKSFCIYYGAGEILTGNIIGTIHDSYNLNPFTYYKQSGTKDVLLPLHNAKVKVTPGDYEYTTDELYNGVYAFKELSPGVYEVTAEAEGYFSYTQTLEVKANETTYFNFMLNKIRDTPPEVINYSPKVSLDETVKCGTQLIFEFNWDVEVKSAEAAFSIVPETAGIITFEDSQHRMIFTPDKPFEINTIYTVKLDKSLKHPADMTMVEDFVMQFKTGDRNRLTMLSGYPKTNDMGVYFTDTKFEFRFDNELNASAIREGFNIYDSLGNELSIINRSWNVNKVGTPYGSVAFSVSTNLTAGETYTISMNRNVIDIDDIDIVDPIEYTFRAMDIRVTDKTILEEFEEIELLKYNETASVNVNSASVVRSTSTKLFGNSSYEFNYKFDKEKDGEVYYNFNNSGYSVNSSKVLGLHIYGDLSGNDIYLQLEMDGETEFLRLTSLDFLGWEFKQIALTRLRENSDYKLVGFKLLQNDAPLTSSGSFFVDNLLVYDELINSLSSVEADDIFKFFPNPVKDKIYVNHQNDELMVLTLYSPDGVLVKKTVGTEILVEGLNAGIYLLNIKAGTHFIVKRIVVVD